MKVRIVKRIYQNGDVVYALQRRALFFLWFNMLRIKGGDSIWYELKTLSEARQYQDYFNNSIVKEDVVI